MFFNAYAVKQQCTLCFTSPYVRGYRPGSLIHNFSPELKREVHDLGKVSIRRCKAECALLFNSIYIKEYKWSYNNFVFITTIIFLL